MSDYIIMAIGAIITAAGAIFSFLEKSKENKNDGKSNLYNLSTFIAIICGVLIALYSGIDSVFNKNESERERKASDSLAKKSQAELQLKSDMIIRLQEENKFETKLLNDSLTTAKSKIISLQTEINNNIIGSLEPCFIVFQTSSSRNGNSVIVNEGKLPILGIEIYITDFNEMMKCKQSPQEEYLIIDETCYNKCTKVFNYPLIKPGPSKLKDYSLPDSSDLFLFEIRFSYNRNIEYMEHLICKRQGNNINCLARLYVSKNNKYELIKIINPDKVDWKVDFEKLFDVPKTQRAFAPIFWR
jgi:hypothetical protein